MIEILYKPPPQMQVRKQLYLGRCVYWWTGTSWEKITSHRMETPPNLSTQKQKSILKTTNTLLRVEIQIGEADQLRPKRRIKNHLNSLRISNLENTNPYKTKWIYHLYSSCSITSISKSSQHSNQKKTWFPLIGVDVLLSVWDIYKISRIYSWLLIN